MAKEYNKAHCGVSHSRAILNGFHVAVVLNVQIVRGDFKTQPPVPSGSMWLSLFRTIETGRNQTEQLVNRRLGFEAVPELSIDTKQMALEKKVS